MKTANISGEQIRIIRKSRGLKQIELVAALSVDHGIEITVADVSKIEHNQRGVRDYELWAIAQVFDVSMDDLISKQEPVCDCHLQR